MQITTNQEEQTHENRRFGAPLSAEDELNAFLEAGDDGDGTAQLEEKLQPENEEGTQLP